MTSDVRTLGKCFVCSVPITSVPEMPGNPDDAVQLTLEGFFGTTVMDGKLRRGFVCDPCVRLRQHLLCPEVHLSSEARQFRKPRFHSDAGELDGCESQKEIAEVAQVAAPAASLSRTNVAEAGRSASVMSTSVISYKADSLFCVEVPGQRNTYRQATADDLQASQHVHDAGFCDAGELRHDGTRGGCWYDEGGFILISRHCAICECVVEVL